MNVNLRIFVENNKLELNNVLGSIENIENILIQCLNSRFTNYKKLASALKISLPTLYKKTKSFGFTVCEFKILLNYFYNEEI